MRVAIPTQFTDLERTTLTRWAGGRTTQVRVVLRAEIVLAAADGKRNVNPV